MKKRPNYWSNDTFYEMRCDECWLVISKSEDESTCERDAYKVLQQTWWNITHPNRHIECNICNK